MLLSLAAKARNLLGATVGESFDILAVLKDDDSYGAHSGCMPERVASEGSCCWRHDCAAHFTGEPGKPCP